MGFFQFFRIRNDRIGMGFEFGVNRVKFYALQSKSMGQLWEQYLDSEEPYQVLSGEKYTTFIALLIARSKFEEEQMSLGQSFTHKIEDCVERKDILGEQNALAEAEKQVSTDFDCIK